MALRITLQYEKVIRSGFDLVINIKNTQSKEELNRGLQVRSEKNREKKD